MLINWKNKNTLDMLYVHDSIFSGYVYDYSERTIRLECHNTFLNRLFRFTFHNVVYQNLQSCAFWGAGNSILYITEIDYPEGFVTLMQLQKEKQSLYFDSFLDKGLHFLSVEIQVNSGDILQIVCESIVVNESFKNQATRPCVSAHSDSDVQ